MSARWPTLGLLAGITMLVQFSRNSHVVVAPDISASLAVSPAALGGLSGALFAASALTQVPGGVLIDRYGTRATITGMLALMAVGTFVFAFASNVSWLTAGRVLIGLGTAVVLMASIIAAAQWFDRQHFAAVTGTLLGLSNLGNVVATAPMAAAAEAMGWRGAFIAVACVATTFALAAWWMLRDRDAHRAGAGESLREACYGVIEVARIPGLLPIAVIALVGYATVGCVIGRWGGPYLADVYGLDTTARGRMLIALAFGLFAGNTAYGWANRYVQSPKRLVLWGGFATVAIYVTLAAVRDLPLVAVVILFGALGVLGSFMTMIIVHGRLFFPDRLVGRGMTLQNAIVLVGLALMQWSSGLVVGAFDRIDGHSPPEAYRAMYALLAVVLAAGLLVYLRARERP